jgi:transcriptional regulator with XRE-family HTH domain
MKSISATHKKLGDRIKQLRKERKMSQEDLAFAMGIDRSYMGFIERGERNATFSRIIDLTKAFKITLSELFKKV